MKNGYEVFKEKMFQELGRLCGENTEIEWIEPQKNNGVSRKAVHIRRKGETIGAVHYLDAYFDRYCQGETIESLAEDLYLCHSVHRIPELPELSELEDFNKVRDKIAFRLVNAEMNRESLKETPHICMMDLAVVCCIHLGKCGTGEMTAIIHTRCLGMWGITKEELFQYAVRNTPRLFPACLTPMSDILAGLMVNAKEEGINDDAVDSVLAGEKTLCEILSNRQQCYGAGIILYEGTLKHAAEQAGKERLLVIPSSVHETILMPLEEDEPFFSMEDIITEINKSIVKKEEWLSNHAYLYEKAGNRLGWISGSGEIKEWVDLERFPEGYLEKGDGCHD